MSDVWCHVFFEILGVIWSPGPLKVSLFVSFCPPGAQRGPKPAKVSKNESFWSSFGTSFSHIFDIFWSMILCVFSRCAFSATLGPCGTQWCPKWRFWEIILTPFLGQGQYVKMCVFLKRQLNFEGSVGSQNQLFLELFFAGGKKCVLGRHFRRFL